jgi:hypothetical protein
MLNKRLHLRRNRCQNQPTTHLDKIYRLEVVIFVFNVVGDKSHLEMITVGNYF